MKSVLMPRVAAPLVVLAAVAFLPTEAHASFVFADPTGFSANYPGLFYPGPGETPSSNYNLLGIGDLGLSVNFQGLRIRLSTTTVDFSTAGTTNPTWMGGVQQMFRLNYTGDAVGGPFELAQLDFTFAREDGEEPNGSTSTSPSWTNTNPTAGWGGGDNTGWTAASAVSGYLQDLGIGTSNDQAVTLKANTDISRVSFYYNAETNPT